MLACLCWVPKRMNQGSRSIFQMNPKVVFYMALQFTALYSQLGVRKPVKVKLFAFFILFSVAGEVVSSELFVIRPHGLAENNA